MSRFRSSAKVRPLSASFRVKCSTEEAVANKAVAISALRQGRIVIFNYEGNAREVEVHTVGMTTAGRWAMSGYQVGGASESGPLPAWRLFCFDECFGMGIGITLAASPRDGFKKGAKQFRVIEAEL